MFARRLITNMMSQSPSWCHKRDYYLYQQHPPGRIDSCETSLLMVLFKQWQSSKINQLQQEAKIQHFCCRLNKGLSFSEHSCSIVARWQMAHQICFNTEPLNIQFNFFIYFEQATQHLQQSLNANIVFIFRFFAGSAAMQQSSIMHTRARAHTHTRATSRHANILLT